MLNMVSLSHVSYSNRYVVQTSAVLWAALFCLVLGSVSSSYIVLLGLTFVSPTQPACWALPRSHSLCWDLEKFSRWSSGAIIGLTWARTPAFASPVNILYISIPCLRYVLLSFVAWRQVFSKLLFIFCPFFFVRWKGRSHPCYSSLARSRSFLYFQGFQISQALSGDDSSFPSAQRYPWLTNF